MADEGDELPPGMQVLNRYTILGKLTQGGMAEVYLARQQGPAGYTKLVVIKRVRPHLANDQDFVAMFVNEARLAALINHPNVVQIFDLGQGGVTGQDWFLAMEFLDGRDMLLVGRACRGHNKAVPFDVTARIIADACHGLEHAHQLAGSDGRPLNLVHRDMSPENILITFEGQVKVLDFGIAKARDNAFRTQAGQIKGKLGYVAPEAILGKPLDGRADIFAIGATLYLFLCGKPAFAGNNPMEIFEKSLKPPMPPKKVNHRVPDALNDICMRCLAIEPNERYQSCGELRQALDHYLAGTGRPLGPPQLAQFMKILFPPDTDEQRQRIQAFIQQADALSAQMPAAPAAVPEAIPFEAPLDDDPEEATLIVPHGAQPSAPPMSAADDYQDRTVEVEASMIAGPPQAPLTATGQAVLDVDIASMTNQAPYAPPPTEEGFDVDLATSSSMAAMPPVGPPGAPPGGLPGAMPPIPDVDIEPTLNQPPPFADVSVEAPVPPPAMAPPAAPVQAPPSEGPPLLAVEPTPMNPLDSAQVMSAPSAKGPGFFAKFVAFGMGAVVGAVLVLGGVYAAGKLPVLLRATGLDLGIEIPPPPWLETTTPPQATPPAAPGAAADAPTGEAPPADDPAADGTAAASADAPAPEAKNASE